MATDSKNSDCSSLFGYAISVGPAAVGCALGLLLGSRMQEKTRQNAALSLVSIGALSLLPLAVGYVNKQLNNPTSKRGSAKTLQSIRDGAVPSEGTYKELSEEEIYTL